MDGYRATWVELVLVIASFALLQVRSSRHSRRRSLPSDRAAIALGIGWLFLAGNGVAANAGLIASGIIDSWGEVTLYSLFLFQLPVLAVAVGLFLPRTRRWAGWIATLDPVASVYFLREFAREMEGHLGVSPGYAATVVALNAILLVWALWVALGHLPGARLRRRGFAWLYDRVQGRHAAFLAERKRALLSGLRGTVLEVGPGTGGNFEFLDRSVRWIGVEPNPHMRKRLARKAKAAGIATEFRDYRADGGLDLDDASVDAVVSTLVQCSVPDPEAFAREVRRVLIPGGRFVFVEHVAAPRGTKLRRLQNVLTPLMTFCADGCHPNRELAATIERAGFAKVEVEDFEVPAGVIPRFVSPHVAGFAIR